MVPALSLDYSSQSADGTVGWEWSLDGLPSITRCSRTTTEDGVHGGINYDSNDRFCLNGQRLMVISGTYGADGSEYRTEIDTFSKILAYGTAGNGPSYFKVWTKSGRILELGNTTDSKVLAVGTTTARAWMVNKIADTKGNYLTVTYTNDTTNGQVYPTRIDYTGNANAGLSTYDSVQFAYNGSRADVTPTYQAGSLIQTTVLLTDIKTYQGSNLVNDYQLAYRSGTSTTHSRLTSVTLCDASSNCLAPTTFGWQGGTGLPAMTSTANGLAQGKVLASGDFNGDGLTDALAGVASTTSCTSGGFIYSGSQSGTFSSANMTMGYTYWPPPNHSATGYNSWACYYKVPAGLLGDFTGDGYTDILLQEVYWYYSGGEWTPFPISNLLINNQAGALNQANLNTSRPQFAVIGDFNGDGRMDGYVQTSATVGNAYLSNGDGTFTMDSGETGLGTNSTIMPADFDGDGCTDMLAQGGTNAIVYFCNPAVSSVTVPNWSGSSIYLGDFNGDGKTDILVVGSAGATLYFSTGTGLSTGYAIANSSTWSNYTIVTGDWDGDGKTDIALISHTSGTPHLIFLSTGTGFTQISSIPNSDTNAVAVVADWNNDGASDIWLQKTSGDTEYLFSYVPEEVMSISNGVGATTTIAYDRLNKNGTFYTKGTSPGYPTLQLDGPYYVVSEVDVSNGIGGTYRQTYSYAGAFGNANSYLYMSQSGAPFRGFGGIGSAQRQGSLLGFTQITVSDLQTNIITTTNYSSTIPYVGMITSQTRTHSGTTLSSVTNTLENVALGSGRYFVGVHQSVVSGNDLNGAALPTTTTTTTYDCDGSPPCYGNATQIAASVSDGSSRTATNTFNNDTTNWFIAELTSSTAQSIVGSSNLTRVSCFQYDSSSGLVTREVIEPVSTTNCTYSSNGVQTDYTLDAYGHRTQATVSGPNITTRSTTASYDALGEFQTGDCNALSQCENWTYTSQASQSFGVPTSHTGPNGLTTSWSYDTFGRVTQENKPDGTIAVYHYYYCNGVNGGTAGCETLGAYDARTYSYASDGVTQNAPTRMTDFDALGRVIMTYVQGFDGNFIEVWTKYDANGRVSQTSRPFFGCCTSNFYWTNYTYDDLGRVTQTTQTNGRVDTDSYNGLTSSVTIDSGGKNQTTSTTLNAQGLNASVTDALSHTTSYVYDAFGDLTTVTDPSGNVITNSFDIRGNKTASSDPDMGSWSYGYDVLGELISQTDAKSQTTTLSYDVLGRMTQRVQPTKTDSWVYDTALHGMGKLASETAYGSTTWTYSYDALGRPSQVHMPWYSYTNFGYAYDSAGRLSTITYPSGLRYQYTYDTYGYLTQISEPDIGWTLWTLNSRDAEMRATQETFGNGIATTRTYDPNTGLLTNVRAGPSNSVAQFDYAYDNLGNLTYRADGYQGTFEYACDDSLNRLTQYAVGNGVTACTSSQNQKTVGYDALGNITSKSDVGTYSYPAAGQAHPHAVSGITGTVNGVVNPAYTYDANGNMTAGAGRTMTYNSFNMVQSITQGTRTVNLYYDPEYRRYGKYGDVENGLAYMNDPFSAARTEYYSGSTGAWCDYLLTPENTSIPADESIRVCDQGGAVTVQYYTHDHLGSVAAVTDQSGTIVERDAYDAWGKRRNLDGSDDTTCSLASVTTRGFTGHEHIDSECLINANARIYDQTIGRFTSADTEIPDSFNGQAYNRFSYVDNGPLSAIDPTGHVDVETVVVTGIRQRINGLETPILNLPIPGLTNGPNPSSGDGAGGGAGAGSGGGIETVVVTADRPKPPLLIAGFFSAGTNKSDRNSRCSQSVYEAGGWIRIGGGALTVTGLAVTLAGVTGMADAAPAALPSGGWSEVPGGLVTIGGLSAMSAGGLMDLGGTAVQGMAGGGWGSFHNALFWTAAGGFVGAATTGNPVGALIGGTLGASGSLITDHPSLQCPL